MKKWTVDLRGSVAGEDMLLLSKEVDKEPSYATLKEELGTMHPNVKDPYMKVTYTEDYVVGMVSLTEDIPKGHGVTNLMYLRKYHKDAAKGFKPRDATGRFYSSEHCPCHFGLEDLVEIRCYNCKQCWDAEVRLPASCMECNGSHSTINGYQCTLGEEVKIYTDTLDFCRAKGCPVEKKLKELIDAEARKRARKEAKEHKLQDDSVCAEAGPSALATLGDGVEANEARDAAEACGDNVTTSI